VKTTLHSQIRLDTKTVSEKSVYTNAGWTNNSSDSWVGSDIIGPDLPYVFASAACGRYQCPKQRSRFVGASWTAIVVSDGVLLDDMLILNFGTITQTLVRRTGSLGQLDVYDSTR